MTAHVFGSVKEWVDAITHHMWTTEHWSLLMRLNRHEIQCNSCGEEWSVPKILIAMDATPLGRHVQETLAKDSMQMLHDLETLARGQKAVADAQSRKNGWTHLRVE